MCGIAGQWGGDQSREKFSKALKKLRHRGPDDIGYKIYEFDSSAVWLGHTRLSIIDLSSAGHQPMESSDQRYAIVFNGEIYNYKELRDDLKALGHQFLSDSDTEVLLAAWMQWNTNCIHRLIGMFAFVVLDRMSGTLTCVRDAFGIKPFFYNFDQSSFYFASEIPALIDLLPKKLNLNYQRTYDYLVHGDYDSNEQTFFEGIVHLPPAHYLEVNLSSLTSVNPVSWWAPKINESLDWSFRDAVDQVREHFLRNIRIHLRSDVQLGAALSGGIDSSAVVCAMRHIEPDLPIHTFSFIASGSDVNEEVWVDRVNTHVGAVPHKVSVSLGELANDLDDMIQAQGEPFGGTSCYAQYKVFKMARESGVTVTLDGQGADEMLAGYSGYSGQRLHSLIETGQLVRAWKFSSAWSKWPGRSRVGAVKRFAAQLSSDRLYNLLRFLNGDSRHPNWINVNLLREQGVVCDYPKKAKFDSLKGRRVVADLARSISGGGLLPLLRHGDRNSMRFSIESRVPFLTTDMVDLLFSMPEDFLISQRGETKCVFRAAMRGIVPDDILDRKDKVNFSTPEKDWLLAMADTVREWLQVDLELDFLNQEKLIQEFEKILLGKESYSCVVWRWVNFCRWYQHFFLS